MEQRWSLLSPYSATTSLDDTNSRLARLEPKMDNIEELLVGYCLDVARIKERLDIK